MRGSFVSNRCCMTADHGGDLEALTFSGSHPAPVNFIVGLGHSPRA